MRRVAYSANPPLNGTIPYGGVGTKIKKSPVVKVVIKNITNTTNTNSKPKVKIVLKSSGSKTIVKSKSVPRTKISVKKKPYISFGT